VELEAPPRTSVSHLALDPGSRPSALNHDLNSACWKQLMETATLESGARPWWWWWWLFKGQQLVFVFGALLSISCVDLYCCACVVMFFCIIGNKSVRLHSQWYVYHYFLWLSGIVVRSRVTQRSRVPRVPPGQLSSNLEQVIYTHGAQANSAFHDRFRVITLSKLNE